MGGMKFSTFSTVNFARALRQIAPDDRRGVMTNMLKRAAMPLERRMSELAPIDPTTPVDLKDSIVTQGLKKFHDSDVGMVELGEHEAAVAVGPSKDAWYGGLVEFGTAPHGTHPGTRAQPFARPAFDETQGQVVGILAREMADYILTNTKVSERPMSTTGRGL